MMAVTAVQKLMADYFSFGAACKGSDKHIFKSKPADVLLPADISPGNTGYGSFKCSP